MAVGGAFRLGAGVRVGSGALDAGFTEVQPPGFAPPPPGVFSHGSTWVAIGAAVWLGVLYLHFHTY